VNTFTLHLRAATQYRRIDGVSAFVGADASGSFGLLAGHARFMTALHVGLARFRVGAQPWQYLAVPGAVLRFLDNELSIGARRFVIDSDFERISRTLKEVVLAEEADLHGIRRSLQELEQQLLKRLWQMGQEGRPG
jgi:F-type H+-transporting ATPase subunit epsilon